MKWLSRLKKISANAKPEATKPTETIFVVSVAPNLTNVAKNQGDLLAANDPAPAPIEVRALPQADSASHAAGRLSGNDFDRWCYPSSTAMTGSEVATCMARLARFADKGVTPTDGEALADKLVKRDRELDDRRLCLECTHLTGYAGSWRCRGWQRAGIALQARDAGLPGDLVRTLQRCDAFTHSINT